MNGLLPFTGSPPLIPLTLILERSAAAWGLRVAGKTAGEIPRILVMKYSTKSLNVRSDRGALCSPPETFSTNFVREASEAVSAVPDSEIIEAALRILAKRMARGSLLANPQAARDYLALRFSEVEHEVFAALYLTKRHHVIACEELFRGTVDGASVHPRIVVKEALRHNAAALIITHNHPSGNISPSQADELITQRLKAALDLIDVRLIDHILGGF
jgi:DNA repair protein RadC